MVLILTAQCTTKALARRKQTAVDNILCILSLNIIRTMEW
jgi:hypothetical protein